MTAPASALVQRISASLARSSQARAGQPRVTLRPAPPALLVFALPGAGECPSRGSWTHRPRSAMVGVAVRD